MDGETRITCHSSDHYLKLEVFVRPVGVPCAPAGFFYGFLYFMGSTHFRKSGMASPQVTGSCSPPGTSR